MYGITAPQSPEAFRRETAWVYSQGAPGVFKPVNTYNVFFDNAGGAKLGAPVMLAGRKIGQINKIGSLALRVIVGDAIKCNVYTRSIGATNMYCGITYPVSCIGINRNRGCLIQKKRNVLCKIYFIELLSINIHFGEW